MSSPRAILLAVCLSFIMAPAVSGQSDRDGDDDPVTLYERGRAEQARSNLLSAVELYRGALIHNPSYAKPLIGLAESFFALEEYDEALHLDSIVGDGVFRL